MVEHLLKIVERLLKIVELEFHQAPEPKSDGSVRCLLFTNACGQMYPLFVVYNNQTIPRRVPA